MKKRMVSRTGPSRPVRVIIVLLLAAYFPLSGCGNKPPEADPRLRSDGVTVTIDLQGWGEARGVFYHYVTSRGKRVDFLICRESSGAWRAYLDACRECYRWRKGYLVQGDEVVCRKCDERFEIDRLAEGRGSCVPIALPGEVNGTVMAIPVASLEEAVKFF